MSVAMASLKEQYARLKAEEPKLRIRNAAEKLNVSEAALVATGVGDTNIRLEGDWKQLLVDVLPLGRVLALTRNDDAVHERKGIYDNISFQGPVGVAVNPDIDLRLFMMHWDTGFAVSENGRNSLQFFDKSGTAVHKIYCLEGETDMDAYQELVKKYTAAVQSTEVQTSPYPAPAPEKDDSEIDVEGFRAEWASLTDTHHFFGLLKKYGITRLQAMRLAPADFVKKVENTVSRKALEMASERQVPIMVFVGSRGCIQIHSGPVNKLMEAGPWFNVLDPDFNLHLKDGSIAHTYIVAKPTEDGIVTAIEAFDSKGEMIVQFFGERKPGIPELESWRTLVKDLTGFSKR